MTTAIISLKQSLDSVYLNESIVNPYRKLHVLFEAREWRSVFTLSEVRRLNEAYNRYLSQASLLYEGVGYRSPIALWEHFLRLEDKVNLNESFADLWDAAKGAAGKVGSAVSGAYKKVRRGLSAATTEKVFGKNKKGKAQETEFKNMISAGAAGAMTGAVPAYFPNNDEFEEFQENLAGALDAAMKYIEKNCKGDGVAASKELINVKKWIVYTADHSLGDRYKHFEGGHRANESFNRKNLKYLYEAQKKDNDEIGTTAGESDAWKSMSSEKLANIFKVGGLLIAGSAFAMMVPGILDSFKHASSGHDVVSQVTDTVTKMEGSDVKVPFDFSEGLDRGIVGGMKTAGFDPTNSDSVKGFYDMMGGQGGHGAFFDSLAKAQGKTGKAHDLFVEYMNQSYDKGVTPTHMGMSASPTSGLFKGMDMSGTTNASLLGMAKPSVTLTGVVTKAVVKSVLRLVTTHVTSGAGGAVAHAGLLAAAPVALAAGLVAAGGGFLISWVRKHGRTKSRLKFLMDTLEQVDALYAKVGGKPEAIAVTPPTPAGQTPSTDSPPVTGQETVENAPPTKGAIAKVILDVLKKKKYKKKPNLEKISDKVADALITGTPTDAAGVDKIIVANMKNIGSKTKDEVIAAVIAFFEKESDDLAEEEDDDNDVEEEDDEKKPEEQKRINKDSNIASNVISDKLNVSKKSPVVVGLTKWLASNGLVLERKINSLIKEADFDFDPGNSTVSIDTDKTGIDDYKAKVFTGSAEKYDAGVLKSIMDKISGWAETCTNTSCNFPIENEDDDYCGECGKKIDMTSKEWQEKYPDKKDFVIKALQALIDEKKLVDPEGESDAAATRPPTAAAKPPVAANAPQKESIRDFANGNIIVERWQRLAGIIR
jgi:hypothetical protein